MSWTPPEPRARVSDERVPGALYGSLLLDQPAHRARVEAFHAFLAPPGPVALEVGADAGAVLIDHARTFPATRWVGLEIRKRKVERALPHLPPNALFWAMDARTVFARVVPEGRLAQVDVWFPTPSDDPRHLLFTDGFVADVARALAPGGVLTVATDVPGMWTWIAEKLTGWSPTDPPPRGEARSRRERVCRREGIPVHGGSFTPGSARTPG